MIGDVKHVCNRGIDKRKIFLNETDYHRFRENLFLLNNKTGKIRTRHEDIFSKTAQRSLLCRTKHISPTSQSI